MSLFGRGATDILVALGDIKKDIVQLSHNTNTLKGQYQDIHRVLYKDPDSVMARLNIQNNINERVIRDQAEDQQTVKTLREDVEHLKVSSAGLLDDASKRNRLIWIIVAAVITSTTAFLIDLSGGSRAKPEMANLQEEILDLQNELRFLRIEQKTNSNSNNGDDD